MDSDHRLAVPSNLDLLARHRPLLRGIWRELSLYEHERRDLFDAPLQGLAAWLGPLRGPSAIADNAQDHPGLLEQALLAGLHGLRHWNASADAAADASASRVRRVLLRAPRQYGELWSRFLPYLAQVFRFSVRGIEGQVWDPLRETLDAFARRRARPEVIALPAAAGAGDVQLATLSLLLRCLGPRGCSYLGVEVMSAVFSAQRGGEHVADPEVDANEVSNKEPDEHPDQPGLADDVLRGLRLLLAQHKFSINCKSADIYVGHQGTALLVPVVLRETLNHLKAAEPQNRRLWRVPKDDEGLVFSALSTAGVLLAPPGRSVIAARLRHPNAEQPSRHPLKIVVIKNDILWTDVPRPTPFAGRLICTVDGQCVDVPGMAKPAEGAA